MTASDSNETSSTGKFILRALVISLLLHLLIYSVWREGNAQKWWENISMPRWMTAVTKAIMPIPPTKLAQKIPPRQSELTFVEIDPAQATAEPPKNAKFQGAKNTVAANREIKTPSDMPNIEGKKEPYIKTTADAPPKKQAAAPVQVKQVPPQIVARQPGTKQTYVPGDMAMHRPSDQAQAGTSSSNTEQMKRVQPQPKQPLRSHYDTIADALAARGSYGAPSSIPGGVNRISSEPSEDVKGTPLGDYMQRMMAAVETSWHLALEHQSHDITGKVVLHLRLHSDGTVSDLVPLKSEVGDLLEAMCERGLKDPGSFGKWSPELQEYIGNSYYDFSITFFYEVY